MEITTVPVTMEVPKESKEIVDFMTKVADHFIQKKPLEEISSILPAGMVAFDGYAKVSEELKSQYKDELAGYLVREMMSRLAPAPVAANA